MNGLLDAAAFAVLTTLELAGAFFVGALLALAADSYGAPHDVVLWTWALTCIAVALVGWRLRTRVDREALRTLVAAHRRLEAVNATTPAAVALEREMILEREAWETGNDESDLWAAIGDALDYDGPPYVRDRPARAENGAATASDAGEAVRGVDAGEKGA